MTTKGKMGCFFILFSGFLFTLERYFSILIWHILYKRVFDSGNGSYEPLPNMPDLKTNIFVSLFLIIGFFFLILEIYNFYREKTLSKNGLKK